MSIEAINWALNLAPVPSSPTASRAACGFVLVGLANHAGPDGRNAFPSVERLTVYTCLSERGVRNALRTLEAAGLIAKGSQTVVSATIERADQRPLSYDLNLSMIDPERGANLAPRSRRGASSDRTGGKSFHDGGQDSTERGAKVAPEPSTNHPSNRTDNRPRAAAPETLPDMPSAEDKPETAKAAAQRLVNPWWNALERKPAGRSAYWASVSVVTNELDRGWTPEQIAEALTRTQPPLSHGSLEYALNAGNRRKGSTVFAVPDWTPETDDGWSRSHG